MPEYLAPGVYVEETSYRAKSIEGVSTSTTAFAGPTRKGPIGVTPALITSLGDFERIYGGLADVDLGRKTNYVAHAVRAYFDNGGSRLYVARVYTPKQAGSGYADSGNLSAEPQTPAKAVNFKARFPGSGLNGRISLRLASSPATKGALEKAPDGTLIRTGAAKLAKAASMEGGVPPFFVPSNAELIFRLTGENADRKITFKGTSAEVTGDALVLNANQEVTLAAADTKLTVTLAGVKQVITLAAGPIKAADLAAKINEELRGGYAKLLVDANPAPNSTHLVIGCDKRGRASNIVVEPNAKLGFAAQQTATNAADAAMLPDLNAVSAQDIDGLLTAADSKVRAFYSSEKGRLILTTTAAGENVGLTIKESTGATAFQLTTGQEAKGEAGDTPAYYVKANNAYSTAAGAALNMGEADSAKPPNANVNILSIVAVVEDADGSATQYEDLHFGSGHPRYIANILKETPTRLSDQIEAPYWLSLGGGVGAHDLYASLFGNGDERLIEMKSGDDGSTPGVQAYESALKLLGALEDVSIVAAPGSSSFSESDAQAIMNALISHAQKPRMYRIAVLDTPPDLTVGAARELRGKIDSKYAALYYPWVVVANPLYRPGAEDQARELKLPPSGFVCGIYARNDIERTVSKAPANEIVLGALRFESDVTFAMQEVLNPIGVNCLRYMSGRGYRVWGARTASSDPEWKYVNVRRYFNFLEASIDRGTQWAVFENNGERLWANIRETVESFLQNEWVNGNLLGATPEEAYFVRCDRTTMTQNDLDNGRLVCLIGVAALKPAEFVIFRIGQKTIDARS